MIRWSAHLSTLFGHLPSTGRPAAAAAAGAETVETWWVEPEDHEAWRRAIGAAGLGVASITIDAGDLAAGERGFLNVPGNVEAAMDGIAEALALAESVGCAHVNVVVGRSVTGVSRRRQLSQVRGILAEMAPAADRARARLLVEPQNPVDVPGYLLPDAAAAAQLVEDVGHPAVRLLYDTYHAAAVGCDVTAELRSLAGVYTHVQYADHPGRGPAGTGGTDLRAIVDVLADVGYDGCLGLEYFPAAGDEDPLRSARGRWPECVRPLAMVAAG